MLLITTYSKSKMLLTTVTMPKQHQKIKAFHCLNTISSKRNPKPLLNYINILKYFLEKPLKLKVFCFYQQSIAI